MILAAEIKPAAPHPAPALWSATFRREREETWQELDRLVRKVEQWGIKRLSAEEVLRLPVLYRATISSLSVARAISLDRNLLEWLEALAGRAYLCVYSPRRHFLEAFGGFLFNAFPRTVRRHRWAVLTSAGLLLLGVVTGMALTLQDPELFYSFVSENMAQGRDPAASTEFLRRTLYGEVDQPDYLAVFASFLFTHNARIGILCFALGFAAGVPVVILLFTNGLILGAMSALFHSRGLGSDWWSWVLPHGITELLAVALCGAAGLEIGRSLLFPGAYTRLASLARRGRESGIIVTGTIFLFLIAGLIEGIFRQTVQSQEVRFFVVLLTGVAWVLFFGLAGRRVGA